MVPEVVYTVCYNAKNVSKSISEQHTFYPAILHGYSRHRVANADYPGIIPDKAGENNTVFGMLVTGLTKANLHKLDYFEGNQYVRREVKVRLLKKVGNAQGEGNIEGEETKAQVYVFKDENDLEKREWDFEEFRRDKLHKWTRAGFVFEDCDPDHPAVVAADTRDEAEN
ncbi:hypothetical protein V8F33_005272 [Rhypophila sp. PSN 637]